MSKEKETQEPTVEEPKVELEDELEDVSDEDEEVDEKKEEMEKLYKEIAIIEQRIVRKERRLDRLIKNDVRHKNRMKIHELEGSIGDDKMYLDYWAIYKYDEIMQRYKK